VKPAPFSYHRPRSLAEALALLAERGAEAKLLAGGQSLGPMLNMRLVQPAHLVDLNAVPGLDDIRDAGEAIEIGALVRHDQLAGSALVRTACPLLGEAAQSIGHYAIRQRGTLGGSLAHADPAAQLPLVAVALGAEIAIAGPRGERRLPAGKFFVSLMETALAADEIVVSARVPKLAPGEGYAYLQFSRRQGDFAIVAIAATLRLDAAGRVARLRLAVGAVEAVPVSLDALGERSKGRAADASWANELAAAARSALEPTESPRVPAVYRSELVGVLTRRALLQALARATRE